MHFLTKHMIFISAFKNYSLILLDLQPGGLNNGQNQEILAGRPVQRDLAHVF